MTFRLRLLLAVLVVLAGGLVVALGVGRLEIDSNLDSLLPGGDPSVTQIDEAARAFGGEPVVVLIEGGGDPLGSDRLPQQLRLEGELAAIDDVVTTYGPATTLNQTVVQIKEFLADLSGQRDALAEAGRTKALQAFEARYGALVVRALPAGLPTLSNENFVTSVVIDQGTGRVKPQWRQYLPADDTVAVYLRPREGLDEAAAGRLQDEVTRVVKASGAVPDGADVTVTGAPVVTVGLDQRMR
ncbi:hypothetical protein BH11ACT8_BH11ACT8_00500 [soil metagenome]